MRLEKGAVVVALATKAWVLPALAVTFFQPTDSLNPSRNQEAPLIAKARNAVWGVLSLWWPLT